MDHAIFGRRISTTGGESVILFNLRMWWRNRALGSGYREKLVRTLFKVDVKIYTDAARLDLNVPTDQALLTLTAEDLARRGVTSEDLMCLLKNKNPRVGLGAAKVLLRGIEKMIIPVTNPGGEATALAAITNQFPELQLRCEKQLDSLTNIDLRESMRRTFFEEIGQPLTESPVETSVIH